MKCVSDANFQLADNLVNDNKQEEAENTTG